MGRDVVELASVRGRFGELISNLLDQLDKGTRRSGGQVDNVGESGDVVQGEGKRLCLGECPSQAVERVGGGIDSGDEWEVDRDVGGQAQRGYRIVLRSKVSHERFGVGHDYHEGGSGVPIVLVLRHDLFLIPGR